MRCNQMLVGDTKIEQLVGDGQMNVLSFIDGFD